MELNNEKRPTRDRLGKWLVAVLGLLAASIGGAYGLAKNFAPTSITYFIQDGSTMQGYTTAMCDAMETYSTIVLTDVRNGQDYRIRKMPDSRCWMIDNLKLGGYTLASGDSDILDSFTIPDNPVQNTETHGNGACIGGVSSPTGRYLTCDGSETQSVANNQFVAYSDPSGVENPTYDNCISRNEISPDSLTGCGYLYNWYTATAGTGGYDISAKNAVAPYSICPANWKLPTGGSYQEFAILHGAMANGGTAASTSTSAANNSNWRYNGPFEGAAAGYYSGGYSSWTNFGYAGSHGEYWSSSVYSGDKGYGLEYRYFLSMTPGNETIDKHRGLAIRCVLGV